MNRLIRKALSEWRRWRFHRRFPQVAELSRKREEARRNHKPTKQIEREMKALVTEALR